MEGGEEELQRRTEEEYSAWLRIAAREIAVMLKKLDQCRITEIVRFYEKCLDHPAALHGPLESDEEETVEDLIAEDRIKTIIFFKDRRAYFRTLDLLVTFYLFF